MNILFLGDVVGKPGRAGVEALLDVIKAKYKIDFVVVNAENSAGGSGLTSRIARHFFRMGCDALTLGDHVWDQKELLPYLESASAVVRPANFPDGTPGKGWCVKESESGVKVGIINLLGRTFMRYNVTCPFKAVKAIAEEIRKETPVILLDFHAETTSEKVAMGHFIDGDISAVVGTHTHVQTADEKVLPKGTAYITDMGMTGPYDSVIGANKDAIIKRFLTSMPIKFTVAKDDVKVCGVVISIDQKTGRAKKIVRVQESFVQPEKT